MPLRPLRLLLHCVIVVFAITSQSAAAQSADGKGCRALLDEIIELQSMEAGILSTVSANNDAFSVSFSKIQPSIRRFIRSWEEVEYRSKEPELVSNGLQFARTTNKAYETVVSHTSRTSTTISKAADRIKEINEVIGIIRDQECRS